MMMEDLSRSPFFDGKLTQLVQKIIWGQKPSAITALDKEFIANAEQIKRLNSLAPGGLVSYLNKMKNYVPLPEALKFLIQAEGEGRGSEAMEALDIVYRDEMLVTGEMLEEILKMGEDMPFGWAVPIIAENGELRHEVKILPKSSLDLSRLKDFK